eukprot:24546-Amphidinium_carterae.2
MANVWDKSSNTILASCIRAMSVTLTSHYVLPVCFHSHVALRAIVWQRQSLRLCLLYTSDAADDTPCVDLG